MIVTPKVEPNTDLMMQEQKPVSGFKSSPFAPISADAVSSSTPNNSRPLCKRRIAFHPTLGYPIPPAVPPKVARRNARERNRVKQVNCGFEMLRSHIPSAAKAKKMSKVDTLRHAVEYIQNLQKMIDEQHHQQHHHQLQLDTMGSHFPINQQHTLTPTHSSRASSIPSPMTPHHPQQSHHFVLPEPPNYPSPLTPKTPNTIDYMVPTNGYTPSSNDSGFESPSFFSVNPSNLMSPNCHRPMSQQQQHPMQTNPMASPQGHQNRGQGPLSASNYNRSSHHQFNHVDLSISSQYYNYNTIIAESPEEEELLDAISKWQDQDD